MIFKRVSIIVVALLVLLSTSVHAEIVPRHQCIAHRGAMDMAPEGTLASFQEAKKAGYSKFECDMWYTKSGEFIICHDTTTKKLSGKSIPAYKLSTKNRKKYPIISGTNVTMYPTQYYLTLQEVLAFAKKNNMKPFIHMKTCKGWIYTPKALKKLNKIIKAYNGPKVPVFFSSNEKVIIYMKNYHWKKGYLTSANNGRKLRKAFVFAKKYSCKYVIHPYEKTRKPKKKDMMEARKTKRKVMCFRISTKKNALIALRRGEDYIITNTVVFDK